MGPILDELRQAGDLHESLGGPIRAYYEKKGLPFHGDLEPIRSTVQGGVGTSGEARRLREHYGAAATGWASPFLLVPEATALDPATRAQLCAAGEDDLYLSDSSPLGVPLNNLRGSSSERWTGRQIELGKPGSPCPRGYLASNTEFGGEPRCTASRDFQGESSGRLAWSRTTPPFRARAPSTPSSASVTTSATARSSTWAWRGRTCRWRCAPGRTSPTSTARSRCARWWTTSTGAA
jgi:hypothetical protein